jgi:hypothetical protein
MALADKHGLDSSIKCVLCLAGERWHFCPMATRLAQAGLVVVVPSYTL